MLHPLMRSLVVFAASLGAAMPAAAAPCTDASNDCTQWIAPGGGTARLLAHSTYALDKRNEAITRALVTIHGGSRNADNYFRSSVAAGFLANALDDTIIVTPRFASNDSGNCKDTLAANELNWPCSGNNWGRGGAAVGHAEVTSYDLADEILRKLARKDIFPNLKTIVFAGHSAGGGFTTRYEMANQVHDMLGVPVTYVVANTSSYTYLDANRPVEGKTEFAPFRDGANCTAYDRWPYGLAQRAGYSARLRDEQLRKQLVTRPVVYLLGQLDTTPLAGFDTSCPAYAQGPHRLGRGEAFVRYIKQNFGAQHKAIVIPMCGHNARCMFTADAALPVLFPGANVAGGAGEP
jgi:pimeloyl-ACP methyl ester carboxylesterase